MSAKNLVLQNPANPIFNEYMPEADFAKLAGVSLQSLRLWHRLRKGPPRVKVGRTILYRRAAVEQWLRKHETQPVEFTLIKK